MTIEEKIEALKNSTRVNDEFTTHTGAVMKVTDISKAGCRMGLTDDYSWASLEGYIRVKAITKTKSASVGLHK